MENIRNR